MADIRIFRWFLALTFLQAIHSAEEITTRLYDRMPVVTGHIRDVIGLFPIISMSQSTFITLNILIVLFLAVIGSFVYRRLKWAMKAAKIVAIIEIINGLLHISAAVYTGKYFPGAISAVGLLAVGIMLFNATRLSPKGMPASEDL